MLNRLFKKMRRDEKGITGLETAIILIAFVVVAAVFAYTVLSAGLFATQKSQEAVYSGLKEARSTLELRGGVIAKADTAGGNVQQIVFTVSGVLGGEAMDFTAPTAASDNGGLAAAASTNKVVINYVDENEQATDLFWTLAKLGNDDGDDLLEQNEKFEVTVGSGTTTSGGGNLIDVLTTDLDANMKFTIEVVTPVGAVLVIERTTPAYIDAIMNLH